VKLIFISSCYNKKYHQSVIKNGTLEKQEENIICLKNYERKVRILGSYLILNEARDNDMVSLYNAVKGHRGFGSN